VAAHHFTVDVEEYFQVAALEPYVPRSRWEGLEGRVARGVDRLLDLLADHDARATFFVLGWIAQREPELVKRIRSAGHEVASHGWDHRPVTRQTPGEFRESIRNSKAVLEEITGDPVFGFRAPNFSIIPGLEWAVDVLIEEGYRYDSSLFPIRRRSYGYPDGQRDPHWLHRDSGCLLEVPPATLRGWGRNLPAAGGAYFRLLPYGLLRSAFSDYERRGVPGTFYIHPWELDTEQPRLGVSLLPRLRHYGGLSRTVTRLKTLLSEFRFPAVNERLVTEEAVL
jgi:polysaccharide deacetylase family protein (PEP-CTERM system associated)